MGCSYSMFICSLGAAQWGCANSSIPSSFLQGNASTESPLTHPPGCFILRCPHCPVACSHLAPDLNAEGSCLDLFPRVLSMDLVLALIHGLLQASVT